MEVDLITELEESYNESLALDFLCITWSYQLSQRIPPKSSMWLFPNSWAMILNKKKPQIDDSQHLALGLLVWFEALLFASRKKWMISPMFET